MELALKSAYHFGYVDAKAGKSEDWENGEEQVPQVYCTDCQQVDMCLGIIEPTHIQISLTRPSKIWFNLYWMTLDGKKECK